MNYMQRCSSNSKACLPRRLNRSKGRAQGFTLMEAALTTVIVGVGVLSIVEAQQAYHKKNDWAARVGTAQSLASELRELTLTLPFHDPLSGATNLGPEFNEADVSLYDDLDDFAGVVNAGIGAGTTFNPPISALGLPINDLDQWTQQIRVEKVSNFDMGGPGLRLNDANSDLMRLTVTVLYQSPQAPAPEVMTDLSWVIKRQEG